MAISLPADVEATLQEQVERGRFATPVEALREAVRLLNISEDHMEFDAKLERARLRASTGPIIRWSDSTRDAIWSTVLESLNDSDFTYDPDVIPQQ
jgi:Arc/MetJ-type ribon-helix-helix transcriptional regulator